MTPSSVRLTIARVRAWWLTYLSAITCGSQSCLGFPALSFASLMKTLSPNSKPPSSCRSTSHTASCRLSVPMPGHDIPRERGDPCQDRISLI
eukprot:12824589-Heterocapsa_arctica.AAC.1